MTAPFIRASIPSTGSETLALLLHGTGGDERDLLSLAHDLLPGSAVLSPRGQSLDEGAPRWFRRLAEGVFDQEDLKHRTRDLADFVKGWKQDQDISDWPVIALGYSNGANMAASLMLSGSGVVDHAILLRPMLPFEPDPLPSLEGSRVFIAAGEADPICRPSQARALGEALIQAGAEVEFHWAPSGHGLTQGDIDAARSFTRTLPA